MDNLLSGQKTYLCALGLAVVAVLKYFQVVDAQLANGLTTLLLGGGLAALRTAMKK